MNSKKMQISYMISAILFMIAGIVLVSWPQTTLKIICYGLGGLTFVYGGFQLYTYYKGKAEQFNFQMNLLTGLIACGIGLFMLLKSEIVISILPFITGFTLLLESIVKFKHAYDLKQAGYDGFKWIVVLGVISLIFAILLMYNPFHAAASMVMFIGICLIVDGLGELWTLYCVRKYLNQVEGEVIDVTADSEVVEDTNTTTNEEVKEDVESEATSTKFVNITVDDDKKQKGELG